MCSYEDADRYFPRCLSNFSYSPHGSILSFRSDAAWPEGEHQFSLPCLPYPRRASPFLGRNCSSVTTTFRHRVTVSNFLAHESRRRKTVWYVYDCVVFKSTTTYHYFRSGGPRHPPRLSKILGVPHPSNPTRRLLSLGLIDDTLQSPC